MSYFEGLVSGSPTFSKSHSLTHGSSVVLNFSSCCLCREFSSVPLALPTGFWTLSVFVKLSDFLRILSRRVLAFSTLAFIIERGTFLKVQFILGIEAFRALHILRLSSEIQQVSSGFRILAFISRAGPVSKSIEFSFLEPAGSPDLASRSAGRLVLFSLGPVI